MMDQATFIGYLVLAIITIGSFGVIIIKLTAPINDLKLVIQELKDCVNAMKETSNMQLKRIDKHGEEIDDLKSRVGKVEAKMESYHGKA